MLRLQQLLAQGLRQGGTALRITAADGGHEQAGHRTFADLVNQYLLLRRRLAGQEKAHVGVEARLAVNQPQPDSHRGQPDQGTFQGRPHHCPPLGSMRNSVRSPSACRYSMARSCPREPCTVMRSTNSAIFMSRGSRVSVHWSSRPARCRL